ncbi:MAG: 50S ribosomal protein L17 [Elusimicrobiales bacterium]|nr:50S ribosomal protein L17 [Elusimicrobiales bacterium]
MIKNYGDKKLSKIPSHRHAMFRNMMASLIINEKIITTLPKAKELRKFFDRLMSDAKKGRVNEVKKEIKDKNAFKKIMTVLVPRYNSRNSGYTSVVNVGYRKGDNAILTMVKLMD